VHTRFGVRSPEVATVLDAVQQETGEVIAPSGAATANQFGLTTQVPLRPVYLTSGRTRHLKLGAQTVELQHVPRWQLTLAAKPAGAVIRVLAWGGRRDRHGHLRAPRDGHWLRPPRGAPGVRRAIDR